MEVEREQIMKTFIKHPGPQEEARNRPNNYSSSNPLLSGSHLALSGYDGRHAELNKYEGTQASKRTLMDLEFLSVGARNCKWWIKHFCPISSRPQKTMITE